jgi:Right handed beta helix region
MRQILTPQLVMLAGGANAIKRLALLVAVVVASCVGAGTAHAQFARTWVSATGTNNTQCSVTSPCQTFAQAIAVTNSGGEIDCLTPGGFGSVTISISVTIDCEGASNGGITVSSGPAITVNTAGIVVNLIGLDLNGLNVAGSGPGVDITAAASVTIRNCKIYGFVTGGHGSSAGTGITLEPGASGGDLVADNVFAANNTTGIFELGGSAAVNMTVRNSNITNNTTYGILVEGGTHAGATIEQTVLSFNGAAGLNVINTGGVAVLGNSTVVNNATGVNASSGGTIYSFKNNQIGGNSTDGTPLTAYPGGPLN